MADQKITDLPALSQANLNAATDVLPVVDVSLDITSKITANDLVKNVLQNPGAIGAGTPSSGVFTTLSASGGITGNLTGDITGNAATATILQTARNINGVSFNGSADITVTAAAGTLTGTALASNVVSANLNSITPTGGTFSITGLLSSTGNITSGGDVISNYALRMPDGGLVYWGAGSSYIIGSSIGEYIELYTAGTLKAAFNSFGIRVIGFLNSRNTDNTALTTTAALFQRGSGVGTDFNFGTIGDTANGIAAVVGRFGSSEITRWTSSGFSITGVLSATGGTTINSITPSGGTLAVIGSISATSLVDISAAGAGQIKFPATQNASADANTLDDYEEGVWTPTLPNGGTIAAASGTSCVYTKIGRQVTVIGYVESISSVPNDSVTFVIGGLPYFPVSFNVNPYGAGAISFSGAADTSDFGGPIMSNGAARIYFHLKSGSAAAVANSTIVARGIGAFIFSLTYFV